ncbi:hypothetical protein DVH24_031378 [Malus domestica]|uniref:Uncharacterized protein n=1 Tax=Malus domestica TaxID=3750 RepID=A0A498HHR4_MALDO|nr:hypothetical protein DVH24_031378 [Malus domestica]
MSLSSSNSGHRCVWYAGRDGTERDEAFRPAFGALKMGGTGCSTGQILGVFAFHLPPWNGFVPHSNILMFALIWHINLEKAQIAMVTDLLPLNKLFSLCLP